MAFYPGEELLLFGEELGICSKIVLQSNNVTYKDNAKCLKLLTLEGPCIIFFAIYIHSNEIHNVVALIVY